MPQTIHYKIIRGATKQLEQQLNDLSKEGWRPIAMGGLSVGLQSAVILEKKL